MRMAAVRIVFSIQLLLLANGGVARGQVPTIDTVDLPFFDDFSGPFPTPYSGYWAKHEDVDCGDQVAIAPPTIGVAVFDALRGDGTFHAQHAADGNACDTLMSRPIRLLGNDSVYLSFQFQPQGWGGQPQPADVLVLDFFDPKQREWKEVWRASFDATQARVVQQHEYPTGKEKEVAIAAPNLSSRFVKAHIPVVRPYRVRGFQFRFRNSVRVSSDTQMPGRQSNTGHWSIDLVYLNAGRGAGDTVYIDDEACVTRLEGVDLPYQEIPYVLATEWLERMEQNPKKELGMRFANLYHAARTVGREYRIVDANGVLPKVESSKALFVPLNPGATEEYHRTYAYRWGALAGREVDVTLEANLKVGVGSALQPFLWNDTVRRRLHFADAYAYDTGVPDNGYGVDGLATAKACAAMRFEPIAAGTIEKVRIYFNPIMDLSTRARFEVVVWNERDGKPGDELYAQRCDPPKEFNRANPFIEYTLDSPVGFSEPLYVGWRQTKADMMQVGIDLHTATPSKIVYNALGAWEESQYKGALMIRLVCSAGGQTPHVAGDCEVQEVRIQAFPNPAHDRVQVQGAPLGSVLQLYSVQGQLVRSARVEEGGVEVDVSELSQGIYLLVVSGAQGGVLASERLVVL